MNHVWIAIYLLEKKKAEVCLQFDRVIGGDGGCCRTVGNRGSQLVPLLVGPAPFLARVG